MNISNFSSLFAVQMRQGAILCLVALFIPGAFGQSRPKPCGISLDPKIAEVWRETQKRFNKAVQCQLGDTRDNSVLASSGPLVDGTPLITLFPRGKNEDSILHELFHLQLVADGYAIFSPRYLPQANEDLEKEVNYWKSTVRDSVLHWIFFPRIRKLGRDPAPEMITDFPEMVRKGEFPGRERHRDLLLTASYFKALMQLPDGALLKQITAWYREKGWNAAITKATDMAEQVRKQAPLTPQKEYNLSIAFLRDLFEPFIKIEVSPIERAKLGQFPINRATITVSRR